MSERYNGKPFLRLLDSYVLDAVGGLSAAELPAVEAAAEAVRRDHGLSGDWRAMVAAEMKFPDGMAGAIREVWIKGAERYRAHMRAEPDAGEFARSFVDQHFPR